MTQEISVAIVTSINEIAAADWDALVFGSALAYATPLVPAAPLLSYAFLSALENTGCVGKGTGWNPHPLIVKQGNQLIGAMPLYLKSHSYGEYVFDWAWADAYQRSG